MAAETVSQLWQYTYLVLLPLAICELLRTTYAQAAHSSVNHLTYYHQPQFYPLQSSNKDPYSNHDATIHKLHPSNYPKYHVHQHVGSHPMAEGFENLVGSGQQYCEARHPDQCCPGRNDVCTMPILDTVCYCDEFCNRTVADCCPDFWGFCMGVDIPDGAMKHPAHMPTAPPSVITSKCIIKLYTVYLSLYIY